MRYVQMDRPAPRMTVAQFKAWERRQILALPDWTPIPVRPGDSVTLTMIGDGSVHTILIVENDGSATQVAERRAFA